MVLLLIHNIHGPIWCCQQSRSILLFLPQKMLWNLNPDTLALIPLTDLIYSTMLTQFFRPLQLLHPTEKT